MVISFLLGRLRKADEGCGVHLTRFARDVHMSVAHGHDTRGPKGWRFRALKATRLGLWCIGW